MLCMPEIVDNALRRAPVALLTGLALLAFAANSLLCRAALAPGLVDPASFTAVRIASGALVLALLSRRPGAAGGRADGRMVLALFGYMAGFSYAYQYLGAATGALLLFGAVQLTMFAAGLWQGERYGPVAWLGLALAAGGLAWLVAPGLSAPHPLGAALMVVAGIAWGVYSLLGRGTERPLPATASAFAWCLPPALLMLVLQWPDLHLDGAGLLLAVCSGALASALGYVIWYAALRSLRAGTAATVQLAVPVLAALGGVVLLQEGLSLRLGLSAAATIGGIAMVLLRQAGTRERGT